MRLPFSQPTVRVQGLRAHRIKHGVVHTDSCVFLHLSWHVSSAHRDPPPPSCVPALSHWQCFVCHTSSVLCVTLVLHCHPCGACHTATVWSIALALCCVSRWHRVLPDKACRPWSVSGRVWKMVTTEGCQTRDQLLRDSNLCYVILFSSPSSPNVSWPCAHCPSPESLMHEEHLENWLGQRCILGTSVEAIMSHLFAEDRCCF